MSDAHQPPPPDKMVIFRGADAPSLMGSSMSTGRRHIAGAPIDEFFSEAMVENSSATVPFRQQAPDGISLVSLDFEAGAMLPRHSHSADCLYYIVSGGIILGRRELGPGDGFFVPSDQPYAYRVGPAGVKLLEFRTSTAFDTIFHERDPARFRAKAEASIAESAGEGAHDASEIGPRKVVGQSDRSA